MGQCTSSAVRDVLNADDVPAPVVAKAPPSTTAKVQKVCFTSRPQLLVQNDAYLYSGTAALQAEIENNCGLCGARSGMLPCQRFRRHRQTTSPRRPKPTGASPRSSGPRGSASPSPPTLSAPPPGWTCRMCPRTRPRLSSLVRGRQVATRCSERRSGDSTVQRGVLIVQRACAVATLPEQQRRRCDVTAYIPHQSLS